MTVARVRRPHGLAGEVVVELESDVPERLAPGSELELVGASGDRRPVTVAASRPHGGGVLVRLAGCAGRDEAEALRGARFEVPRERVPPAPAGSYYYFELEGCSCRDLGSGELGRVTALIEDGGGLLLEVDDGERRLLVPFVGAYLRRVDVAGRRIDLELPAGLVETCTSRS